MALKITGEHYDELRKRIIGNSKLKTLPEFLAGQEPGKPRRTAIGWRFYIISATPGLTQWVCDVLYKYLDDTHIDSALRRITGTD